MNIRITLTLPKELVAAAQTAVADGRAASVSAYVASAMEEKTTISSWSSPPPRTAADLEPVDDLLAEWTAELGPPTPEENAWVQDALDRMRPGRD